MTATPGEDIDPSVVSTQSGDPPQQSSQSTDSIHNSTAGSSQNAAGGKENTSPGNGARENLLTSNPGGGKQDAVDDFGLPIRVRARPVPSESDSSDGDVFHDVVEHDVNPGDHTSRDKGDGNEAVQNSTQPDPSRSPKQHEKEAERLETSGPLGNEPPPPYQADPPTDSQGPTTSSLPISPDEKAQIFAEDPHGNDHDTPQPHVSHTRLKSSIKASESSHQRLTGGTHPDDESAESDDDWRAMPALGELDVYDDFGRLVARGSEGNDDDAVYSGQGGAGKGYTRVQLDEDAQSATSLDEDTGYLFKEAANNSIGVEDDELRDAVSQLQATKDLLTESQRIAYVGVTRLAIHQMAADFEKIPPTKGTRKILQKGIDSLNKWGQIIMARLYAHMDINPPEQIMIEQLAEHGVEPADLVRPLMENARVKNPLAEDVDSPKKSTSSAARSTKEEMARTSTETDAQSLSTPVPPYEAQEGNDGDLPEVRTPSQLPTTDKIDIDLRWTVLCDLFLVLIADSTYDARSRALLERVGKAMDVSWLQISRFEKRVIDALEMQETADKETWDETENMEKRRKMALKRKYITMGLATVGGGLVIGLSAGLLAPVIGAGMAAGLTTIGVSGTSTFLGGVGGTALIASGATLTGSGIGLKASHRRTGAVQTFEYRPLHNNKRVNLIVTVGGWMTGKVDDIRLPYSTVDPIMGDIYSVLWEPEMLQSMGDTINILATEVRVDLCWHESTTVDISSGFNPGTATCSGEYNTGSSGSIPAAAPRSYEAVVFDR